MISPQGEGTILGKDKCINLSEEALKEFKNLKINKKDQIDEIQDLRDKKEKSKEYSQLSKRARKRIKRRKIEIVVFNIFKIILFLTTCSIMFIYIFFKTEIFQKYKEIWVETAMSTMNHQYLATWFLTDDEINEILSKLEVVNEEDTNIDEIEIPENNEEDNAVLTEKSNEITIEKITGKNYVGYVMIIPDPSKVSLVDSRNTNYGTKLTQICENNNAIAGINAGGFADPDGTGNGNKLCDATIINKKLLYGSKGVKYSLIGLTANKKLVLGNYTYEEAIQNGIVDAIDFGPFLIVNGNNQITNANSGGIHPRTAIGQRKDGTFIFVVIDGRQVGYSLGTNLLELQEIFNRYGAYNAANLDGGSSTTMVYDGEVVNKTSTPIGQRYLPNAFIVEE